MGTENFHNCFRVIFDCYCESFFFIYKEDGLLGSISYFDLFLTFSKILNLRSFGKVTGKLTYYVFMKNI